MKNLFKLKSFFKFLDKNRLYTFIEIFGMSVSFMFVILIAAYTYQELSTDRFQKKAGRIYVMANEENFGSAYKLAAHLENRFPEIEMVCPIISYYRKTPVQLSEKKINADLVLADSTFFKMFTFDIKEGDRVNPLAARGDAVISRSFANKAFPDRDPLGETIQIDGFNGSVKVTVNAIMEDIRNSTIHYADVVLRIDNIQELAPWEASESFHSYGGTTIFLLEKEGANLQAKTDEVLSFLKEITNIYRVEHYKNVSFVPLRDIYFSSLDTLGGRHFSQGDWTFVMILLSVGLLILIFAIINYVNLTVAQTGFRAKEMATRRLLGSSREELFSRLMMESTLLSLGSFVLGLLLAFAAVPFVNNLLDTRVDLVGLISPATIVLSAVVVVLMGTVSGFIPAVIISNAKPVEVVKGAFRQKTKMVFSKVFITFQNVITIALVTASITMIIQINHLINAPLGYNITNIIDVPVESLRSREQALLLAKEMEQLGVVKRIGLGQSMPFNIGNNYSLTMPDGRNVSLQAFRGDSTYVNILGFQIVKDNNLATDDGIYLTPRAFSELDLTEDAPSVLLKPFWDEPRLIAGTVKEFQLRNILYENRPIFLQIQKQENLTIGHLAVEVTGNSYEAMEQVKGVYEKITQLEFPGKFIDQQVEESFIQQRRTSQIVVLFACVAVLLSLLGLLAMSTYFIQQRSREIAIRKIFGSDNPQVLKNLVFTFLSYVVIAFIIVSPFIWYLLKQWLSGYSYRISLSPWIFVLSGLFCMFAAFCTVFWQSYQAANRNPVDSIKAE